MPKRFLSRATQALSCASHLNRCVTVAVLLVIAGCGGDHSTSAPAAPTYTLGGTISGLPAGMTGLVLANGSTTLAIAGGSTTFVLPGLLKSGTAYDVTVYASPAGVTCSVASGSGTVATANISNVVVTCADQSFTIGGSITGLSVAGLVLTNGADVLQVPANATVFTMPTAVAYTASYAVTVTTQPAGESCTVTSGTGTVPANNVTSVSVMCTATPFTLGGSVSGLNGAGLVLANGADSVTVPVGATTFTLPTPVDFGAQYTVTVQAQPAGIICTVSQGSGTMPAANVTSVAVACSDQSFHLGGSIAGLTTAGLVLANGSDTVTVQANATTFTLPTLVAYTSGYAVSVQSQPVGLTCTASSATGTMPAGDVTSVAVTCAANSYTLGGTISGLTATGLVLSNGTDTVRPAANATTFSFPNGVAYNASYTVTVTTQPSHMTCSVTNGSGTMPANAVTSVAVSCVANGNFAYSPDYNNSKLLQYSVNPSTQLLSSAPTASIATGTTPIWVVATPNGKFLYTANRNGNNISEYGIDPVSGTLTSIGTVSAQAGGIYMVINAAGTFAYEIGTSSGSVAAYSIGTNGVLTPIAGSPFASGTATPYSLALNPANSVLYVAGYNSNTVQAMAIDASTGALSTLGTPVATSSPFTIVVNPAGTYAYVVNRNANTVSEFSIGSTGLLTSVGAVPTSGNAPVGLAIDPTGKFVYTANNGSQTNAVTAYTTGTGGALTQVGTSPTALYPAVVTVNAAGTTLYAVNNGDATHAISAFSINAATGVLTAIGSSSGPSGSAQNGFVLVSP